MITMEKGKVRKIEKWLIDFFLLLLGTSYPAPFVFSQEIFSLISDMIYYTSPAL